MPNKRELKSLRVLKGYTMQEMADAIGKSSTTYLHKENGETAFTDGEKLVLVKMLGLSFEQFNRVFFEGELPY